jgi:rhodanese-related sulfurtransferase
MMLKNLTSVALLSLTIWACDAKQEAATNAGQTDAKAAADPHANFTNLSVDEVDKLVAASGCVAVDANGADTRGKYGTVPGAVLLSNFDSFKSSELPTDKSKKLVFYCGGEKCTAAPKAAKIAQDQGYTDVNVMRAGIRGWVDAGKKTDKPST